MHFDLLLMTSRSGSSMIADIFVRHGYYWASNEKRNPVVGGKKVRYNSFENQAIKDYNKTAFGTPLGDMITFDDEHVHQFSALLRHEYSADTPNVWKGAVEFFPLWRAMIDGDYVDSMTVSVVYRSFDDVIDSVLAKRNGRGDREEARRITQKRYDIMHRLISDYALSPIFTDEIVEGDFSSLEQAWDADKSGIEFDPTIVRAVVNPNKWKTDR